MKIIAYFLPQFHEVEENNKWWGKGFTEWTNIKSAHKYFPNHSILTPLDDYYYDLTNIETIKWQTRLANEYGIYGFCYYHYWFEGKMILEKPAEILLKEKGIPQRFCFCWANHSWKKTWNGTNEILIEQDYGKEKEWHKHFNYLLPFFQDERYIKIDNKPIFMLYDSKSIKYLDERILYFDKRCKEVGFKGIYIIESINSMTKTYSSELTNAITLREPSVTLSNKTLWEKIQCKLRLHPKNKWLKPFRLDYSKTVRKSLEISKEYQSSKEIMLGSFTGWDSTPRHKNRGFIISNSNPNIFSNYLREQHELIKDRNLSEFVFLNAWNEWAEGMVLEPTNQYQYEYLEKLIEFK